MTLILEFQVHRTEKLHMMPKCRSLIDPNESFGSERSVTFSFMYKYENPTEVGIYNINSITNCTIAVETSYYEHM